MKPVAKEAKMNKAEAHQPKSGHAAPAGKSGGKSNDAGSMHAGAAAELMAQHPHAHHDHGPHHGTTTHQRHVPMKLS